VIGARGTEPLAPGSTFGRYAIVRAIGSGGMATVYEARHTDLQKRVALKVLHPALALRIDVVQRFVLEARAASRLAHPHVVGISDIGAVDGLPFMAMDFLEGAELAAVLDHDGPLPIDRLADIMLPVLSAVAAAHEAGVLHRDLKPDNIFLAKQRPYGEKPVLLDFGISKFEGGAGAQPLTAAGELLGTPPYMAPEQVSRGMAAYDEKSDQYALGVVLYECATRAVPFVNDSSLHELMADIARGGAKPPSSIRPGIPAAFDAVVARAMSLSPDDRFPSVIELGAALLPFASGRGRALWGAEFEAAAAHARSGPALVVLPSALRVVPVLAEAPEAELARLLEIGKASRIAGGAALFDQSAPAATCVFVIDGEVELYRTHAADTWEIEVVETGATLGLAALWDEGTRPASAVARTPVVALSIERRALGRLGEECPEIASRLHEEAASAAAARLRKATARVADLLDRQGADASREDLVRLAAAIGEWSAPVPRGR
jgi:CRP-like cAMP-binding protein/tRNA A-37 threonylcarbamoyl transferase component Bud32